MSVTSQLSPLLLQFLRENFELEKRANQSAANAFFATVDDLMIVVQHAIEGWRELETANGALVLTEDHARRRIQAIQLDKAAGIITAQEASRRVEAVLRSILKVD